MAVALSRTYLGAVATRVASSSRTVAVCYAHPGFGRNYTTTVHTHRKEPAPNHPGRKNASAKVPPPPKQKAEAKKPHVKNSEGATLAQVEEMERVMAFQHLMPTVDPWGQAVQDTLDVVLPRPISLDLAKNPVQLLRTLALNMQNRLKSYMAMNQLRVANAPAEKDTSRLNWSGKIQSWIRSKRAPKLRKEAVLGPIKEVALETYVDLNNAVANRNIKEISRFATSKYQEQMLALCKHAKSQNASGKMIWQLHRVVSPVNIVSLRCTEGYMARASPRFGNRLMVHALIKFDTEQSLEMYDAKGRALHPPATASDIRPNWGDEKTEAWRVPAERRRVTEYLVLEKRMWTQSPWQFREQLW